MHARGLRSALLAAGMVALGTAADAVEAAALRVCADPGNLPFSNRRGEGLENKIAQLLASPLGSTVEYYYRPGVERGLTRTTLDADQCDVMLDMPVDAEDVITTTPLYRTTYVLAYRNSLSPPFKGLDDPRLKTLRVGVYETSAIREALVDHGVGNVAIHYLSHDADLVPEDQPSYQVQQVLDGQIDVAAVWGPLAGYYRAVKRAPITIQPANLMDDNVRLEFDMAIALRRNDKDLLHRLEQAMQEQREAIRAVLNEFGVPLVRCEQCLVSGDLPSHGPYAPPPSQKAHATQTVSIATLNNWLAHGADVNVELNDAVMANDRTRVAYLLDHKHASVTALDLQGQTPLHHAVTQGTPEMVEYLITRGANVNERDHDGWTPIMTAAWVDDAADIKLLVAHGADPNTASPQNLTPLGIAVLYGKDEAALALIESGADLSRPIGEAGYTPLMLAVANHSERVVEALIQKGADVNAHNSGGVTPLMIAATSGRADMVALLLRSGANVSAQTERGDTALSIARTQGDPAVVKLLSDAQSGANASGHPGA